VALDPYYHCYPDHPSLLLQQLILRHTKAEADTSGDTQKRCGVKDPASFLVAFHEPAVIFKKYAGGPAVYDAVVAYPGASGFQAGGFPYGGDSVDLIFPAVFPDDFEGIDTAPGVETCDDIHIDFRAFMHVPYTPLTVTA
jgi:hypothetical protein